MVSILIALVLRDFATRQQVIDCWLNFMLAPSPQMILTSHGVRRNKQSKELRGLDKQILVEKRKQFGKLRYKFRTTIGLMI